MSSFLDQFDFTDSADDAEDDSGDSSVSPLDSTDSWTTFQAESSTHLAHIDIDTTAESVVGDPNSQLERWRLQEQSDTCAIAFEGSILSDLTGMEFTEAELQQEAISNGWHVPGGGTAPHDVGKLLELYGFEVERAYNLTFDEIEQKLEVGQQVIVGVNAHQAWGGDIDELMYGGVGDYPGVPGQDLKHTVAVIGVDYWDPQGPMVIVNDPGHPDGQGLMAPREQFIEAWSGADNFTVSTTGETLDQAAVREVRFGWTAPGVEYPSSSAMVAGHGVNQDGVKVDNLGYPR